MSFLRNSKVEVDEISGFVVPVQAGYVDKVVCKWKDSRLRYYLEPKHVEKSMVITEIKSIFGAQQQHAQTALSMYYISRSLHTLPITPSFLEMAVNDNGAYQLMSSLSVVLLSPKNNKVYKHPIGGCEFKNLQGLYIRKPVLNLQYSALPIEAVLFGETVFFYIPQVHKATFCQESKF